MHRLCQPLDGVFDVELGMGKQGTVGLILGRFIFGACVSV